MPTHDALEELQDLAFGPDGPLTSYTPEAHERRNALLRPLIRDGVRLVVCAGGPIVGLGHHRAGLIFPRDGRTIEVAAESGPGEPARVSPADLEAILSDSTLRVMPAGA